MNGKRCAIFLGKAPSKTGGTKPVYISRFGSVELYHQYWHWRRRIYGSHSEAKRELKKWLPSWPDAKIVEEMDL